MALQTSPTVHPHGMRGSWAPISSTSRAGRMDGHNRTTMTTTTTTTTTTRAALSRALPADADANVDDRDSTLSYPPIVPFDGGGGDIDGYDNGVVGVVVGVGMENTNVDDGGGGEGVIDGAARTAISIDRSAISPPSLLSSSIVALASSIGNVDDVVDVHADGGGGDGVGTGGRRRRRRTTMTTTMLDKSAIFPPSSSSMPIVALASSWERR